MAMCDVIREKVDSIHQLPTLPAVATEIVDLVDDPATSASKLGQMISSDVALTANLLKIANSPSYGFSRKISTIDFAVIVLGFDALKDIVLSVSLVSTQRSSAAPIDAREFWHHSASSGIVARKLARDLGYRISGEVFVAAQLHDMGISFLFSHFPDEYRRVLEVANSRSVGIVQAEKEILGLTHAEVGQRLADRWNFPDHLSEAIAYHHSPSLAKINPDLVSIVHVADVLSFRLKGVRADFDAGSDFESFALERLRLSDSDVLDGYVEARGGMLRRDVQQVIALSGAAG